MTQLTPQVQQQFNELKKLLKENFINSKEVFTSAEKAALPQLKPKADPVTFAEIPVSNSPSSSGSDSFVPDAVIRMGHTTIALSNTASDALISKILEVLNAC